MITESRKKFSIVIQILSGIILVSLVTLISPFSVTSTDNKISNVDNFVYLPVISNGYFDLYVDVYNRQSSQSLYNSVFTYFVQPSTDWNGNHNSCDAGDTSDEFKLGVMMRINYYRAMAGVPEIIGFNEEYNRKAQETALMMSVKGLLSHEPTPDWTCYTQDGKEGANSSNLFLGYYGTQAIDGYIADNGSGNYAVGHRRWVLHPPTQHMGTGDIPQTPGYPAANALWVFDPNVWGPRPSTRDDFVAWPPPGYVPYQVIFPRWSFSYPNADFSSTQVSMNLEGEDITLYVQPLVPNSYGENTIVWEPVLTFPRPPSRDYVHNVSLTNVVINGTPHNFTYQVIIFDPNTESASFAPEDLAPVPGPPPRIP